MKIPMSALAVGASYKYFLSASIAMNRCTQCGAPLYDHETVCGICGLKK